MKIRNSFFFYVSGSRILGVTVTKEQMYPMKLKGISICFSMLKAALCGSYVNFGVFRLYGDDALDNALNSFVKLLLSIPQSDLLVSFKKWSSNFVLVQDYFYPVIFLGLSQTVSDLLRAFGMSGSRPHELSCHNGTPSVHVHSVIHLWRAHCPRWEPQLFYRCLTQKLFGFSLYTFFFLKTNFCLLFRL